VKSGKHLITDPNAVPKEVVKDVIKEASKGGARGGLSGTFPGIIFTETANYLNQPNETVKGAPKDNEEEKKE
jgi:hypothetical protein